MHYPTWLSVVRTVQSTRLPSINRWLLNDFTASPVSVAPPTPHSHDPPKPHNVCVCVFHFITFVICLFVCLFVVQIRRFLCRVHIHQHRMTHRPNDPSSNFIPLTRFDNASEGGLKSNQSSCAYSPYVVLPSVDSPQMAAFGRQWWRLVPRHSTTQQRWTITGQLLPCHFGGADNSQCQRWRKWWPCGGGANVGGSICSSADHYRIKRLSFLRKSTRKNWEKE